MDRAIDDIEKITAKMDTLLDWRGRMSGGMQLGLTLVSVFGLAICSFIGWGLWNDNTRIVQVETDLKLITGYADWKAKTDQRLENIEEKEIKAGTHH